MAKYGNLRLEKALDGIEEYIDVNKLKEYDFLPAERQLAEDLGLSRGTVREALKLLEREGRIIKLHGKGSFLAAEKHSICINEMLSFSTAERNVGNTPGSKIIFFGIVRAGDMLASRLNINKDDKAFYLCRVRTVNDRAVILENAYLPETYFLGLNRFDFEKESLYDILEREYGVKINMQTLDISLSRATEKEAEYLDIEPDDIVFVEKANAFGNDNEVVEFTKSIIIARAAKYRVQIKRNANILMLDELKLSVLVHERGDRFKELQSPDKFDDVYWNSVKEIMKDIKANGEEVCFVYDSNTPQKLCNITLPYSEYIVCSGIEPSRGLQIKETAFDNVAKSVILINDNSIDIYDRESAETIKSDTDSLEMKAFLEKLGFGIARGWSQRKCVSYALNKTVEA